MAADRPTEPDDHRHDDQHQQPSTNDVGEMHLRSLALTRQWGESIRTVDGFPAVIDPEGRAADAPAGGWSPEGSTARTLSDLRRSRRAPSRRR